jgi:putative addiction module antidote
MYKLKLTQAGNDIAAILPAELAARLQVGVGDALFAAESPDGFVLTPHDPEFVHQVHTAATIMQRRRDALKALCR